MSLIKFLNDLPKPERERFAKDCDSVIGHILNCAYGSKPFNARLAALIEKNSRGRFTAEQLNPSMRWVRVKDQRWPNPKGRPLLDVAASDRRPSKQKAEAA